MEILNFYIFFSQSKNSSEISTGKTFFDWLKLHTTDAQRRHKSKKSELFWPNIKTVQVNFVANTVLIQYCVYYEIYLNSLIASAVTKYLGSECNYHQCSPAYFFITSLVVEIIAESQNFSHSGFLAAFCTHAHTQTSSWL